MIIILKILGCFNSPKKNIIAFSIFWLSGHLFGRDPSFSPFSCSPSTPPPPLPLLRSPLHCPRAMGLHYYISKIRQVLEDAGLIEKPDAHELGEDDSRQRRIDQGDRKKLLDMKRDAR